MSPPPGSPLIEGEWVRCHECGDWARVRPDLTYGKHYPSAARASYDLVCRKVSMPIPEGVERRAVA